jgi:hypothetical protein
MGRIKGLSLVTFQFESMGSVGFSAYLGGIHKGLVLFRVLVGSIETSFAPTLDDRFSLISTFVGSPVRLSPI